MRKNTVEPDRPQMTIRRMRFACWIPRATNTHSEYVILIGFLLQQWSHEHASMLGYTYIACLILFLGTTTKMFILLMLGCDVYSFDSGWAWRFNRGTFLWAFLLVTKGMFILPKFWFGFALSFKFRDFAS